MTEILFYSVLMFNFKRDRFFELHQIVQTEQKRVLK